MKVLLVRGLIFLAVGLALGVAQARSLRTGERSFRETGERARPTANFIFWLIVLAVVAAVLVRSGPLAFGSAFVGYAVARAFSSARHRPKNEDTDVKVIEKRRDS